MGPLIDEQSLEAARQGIQALTQESEVISGDPNRRDFQPSGGYFMEPILLRAPEPETAERIHRIEVFGPVATVLRYESVSGAVAMARKGGGSLVGSICSEDEAFIEKVTSGLAAYHGRLMVMNAKAAPESTGHGVVMPHLVHGGPGRAGGGEELGGLRSVYHFMQRLALQGDPEKIERLTAVARVD